jgi:hypothetical protein
VGIAAAVRVGKLELWELPEILMAQVGRGAGFGPPLPAAEPARFPIIIIPGLGTVGRWIRALQSSH